MKKNITSKISQLEKELEKQRNKLDAIELLAEEEPVQTNLETYTVSSVRTVKAKRRGDVTENIKKAVEAMPSEFLTKDLTEYLSKQGLTYPSSTVSTTLLRFIKMGSLSEGEKKGKGRTYLKEE
jgi:hypothetical protein